MGGGGEPGGEAVKFALGDLVQLCKMEDFVQIPSKGANFPNFLFAFWYNKDSVNHAKVPTMSNIQICKTTTTYVQKQLMYLHVYNFTLESYVSGSGQNIPILWSKYTIYLSKCTNGKKGKERKRKIKFSSVNRSITRNFWWVLPWLPQSHVRSSTVKYHRNILLEMEVSFGKGIHFSQKEHIFSIKFHKFIYISFNKF